MSGTPPPAGGFARKRRFEAAGGAAGAAAKKPRKVSTDVYPDPEPDAPEDVAALAARLQGAVALQQQQQRAAGGRLVVKGDKVYDAFGREVPQDAASSPAPAAASAAAAAAEVPAAPARKARVKLDGSGPDGRHTARAEKIRRVEEARREYAEKRREADAALAAGAAAAAAAAVPEGLSVTPKPERLPFDAARCEVPEVEWWDQALLTSGNYSTVDPDKPAEAWGLRTGKLTELVEHPVPAEGQHEEKELPPEQMQLTFTMRRKLRKQRRAEAEEKRREEIRLNLREAPAPRVKLSNMAAVFKDQFAVEPTRVEMVVREEEAARLARHEQRNLDRKLEAKEGKRERKVEKAIRQAEEDPLTHVYRIDKLDSSRAVYKIVTNAKQLYITGFLIVSEEGSTLVVAEAGRRPMAKFDRLLRHRIDYELEEGKTAADNVALVWKGYTGKRRYDELKKYVFADNAKARAYLTDVDCGHYWDMMVEGREEEQQQDAEADDLDLGF